AGRGHAAVPAWRQSNRHIPLAVPWTPSPPARIARSHGRAVGRSSAPVPWRRFFLCPQCSWQPSPVSACEVPVAVCLSKFLPPMSFARRQHSMPLHRYSPSHPHKVLDYMP
ncbi:unnamed protein product, partial [Urochloa humidicola]